MSYQKDHLVDPRKYKERSIMPSYRYLSEQDLNDIAAFLVSLGNKPGDLRTGSVSQPTPPAELSELAKQGQALYRQMGCVGCHSINGSANAGPTWLGLYGSTREVQDKEGNSATLIAEEIYLKESMTDPGAQVVKGFSNFMPPINSLAGRPVTDEELQAIIEYIKSLAEVR